MLRCCHRGLAAVCLVAGLCLPALAQQQPGAGARAFTPSEHLMHQIIASYFGLSHQEVMDLAARGYTYEDIATAANIAARSGRPLTDVAAMHDRNMGWTDVAQQVGVPVADYNRPYYHYTGPEPVMYEERVYVETVGIPTADFERYHRMGYSGRDIAMAYNTAARAGRSPDEVFAMLDRGMTWSDIAAHYNLAMSDIQAPRMRVAAERSTMGTASPAMAGTSPYAMPNTNINWSRAYVLTPVEMKRLRAMGLRDSEIYAIANGARMSGMPVDSLAQKIFRGETVDMIAQDLNVRPNLLTEVNPMWKTPEWEEAVKAGSPWIPIELTGSMPGMSNPRSMNNPGTMNNPGSTMPGR